MTFRRRTGFGASALLLAAILSPGRVATSYGFSPAPIDWDRRPAAAAAFPRPPNHHPHPATRSACYWRSAPADVVGRAATATTSATALFAKKGSKKKKQKRNTIGQRTASSSGFGGAATEPCPCGSGEGYMKCCGLLHKSADAYAAATAEQVVRARYSAYAKREVDFIVGSTHPLNKDFMTDIEHWKETIRNNCYDNFELTSCKILSESYEGEGDQEVANVQFVATMIQVDSRERTAFMETSKFERAGKHIRGGAWLYRSGVIETAPGYETEEEEEGDEGKEGGEGVEAKEAAEAEAS